jgi:hypothetical protein
MSIMSSINREFVDAGLPWHLVEEAINREIECLERVIEQTVIGKVPGYAEETHRKYHPLAKPG